jgi:hypothetical protein
MFFISLTAIMLMATETLGYSLQACAIRRLEHRSNRWGAPWP